MKKLSWFNKVMYGFNIVITVLTFVAYVLPFLAPKMFPLLSVLRHIAQKHLSRTTPRSHPAIQPGLHFLFFPSMPSNIIVSIFNLTFILTMFKNNASSFSLLSILDTGYSTCIF